MTPFIMNAPIMKNVATKIVPQSTCRISSSQKYWYGDIKLNKKIFNDEVIITIHLNTARTRIGNDLWSIGKALNHPAIHKISDPK